MPSVPRGVGRPLGGALGTDRLSATPPHSDGPGDVLSYGGEPDSSGVVTRFGLHGERLWERTLPSGSVGAIRIASATATGISIADTVPHAVYPAY